MIKAVKKATDILLALSNSPGEVLGLSDVAKFTANNKSTCVHILETLCECGFVEHKSRKDGYRLGPFTYYLTRNGRFGQQLIQVCHPIMRWLCKQTQQTVILATIYGDKKLIIHYVEGELHMHSSFQEITLGSIYSTATGQILLAHMPPQDLEDFMKKTIQPEDIWADEANKKSLSKQLSKIRARGFAVLKMDRCVGYACPIHDHSGNTAAIGVACACEPEDEAELIGKLRTAAKEINRRLNFDESIRIP